MEGVRSHNPTITFCALVRKTNSKVSIPDQHVICAGPKNKRKSIDPTITLCALVRKTNAKVSRLTAVIHHVRSSTGQTHHTCPEKCAANLYGGMTLRRHFRRRAMIGTAGSGHLNSDRWDFQTRTPLPNIAGMSLVRSCTWDARYSIPLVSRVQGITFRLKHFANKGSLYLIPPLEPPTPLPILSSIQIVPPKKTVFHL